MEALIELVAASLARHGIVCPDTVSKSSLGRTISPVAASTEPPNKPTALPEHNFRRKSENDPAP